MREKSSFRTVEIQIYLEDIPEVKLKDFQLGLRSRRQSENQDEAKITYMIKILEMLEVSS